MCSMGGRWRAGSQGWQGFWPYSRRGEPLQALSRGKPDLLNIFRRSSNCHCEVQRQGQKHRGLLGGCCGNPARDDGVWTREEAGEW